MGLLDRFRKGNDSSGETAEDSPDVGGRGSATSGSLAGSMSSAADEGDAEDEMPLRPRLSALAAADREHIESVLARLAGDGVDVDSLDSIATAYERELSAWEALKDKARPDHAPIVDALAIAVGEHLVRNSDLEWCVVRDAFGSAVAVAQSADDFVVVPRDLVGVRWLSRRHGWMPDVVSHMLWVRADRAR